MYGSSRRDPSGAPHGKARQSTGVRATLELLMIDPLASIPGLRLASDVLSEAEESDLLRQIEDWSAGWERPLLRAGLLPARREMRCFGWSYVTRGRSLTPCEPLPPALAAAMQRWLTPGGVDAALLEQVIVTRYRPGAGIGWHTDAPVFGPVVATLSLGTDWRMEFRRRAGDKPIKLALPRRSLLVLEDEARRDWQHRIPEVKSTRISLSFRTVRDAA
jgi:alkylated DNA repair dioxygenase AlkB